MKQATRKERDYGNVLAVLFRQDRHSKDCFLRLAMAVKPQLREPYKRLVSKRTFCMSERGE